MVIGSGGGRGGRPGRDGRGRGRDGEKKRHDDRPRDLNGHCEREWEEPKTLPIVVLSHRFRVSICSYCRNAGVEQRVKWTPTDKEKVRRRIAKKCIMCKPWKILKRHFSPFKFSSFLSLPLFREAGLSYSHLLPIPSYMFIIYSLCLLRITFVHSVFYPPLIHYLTN